MKSLGLLGSTVIGRTSQGGVTTPTFPKMRTAPVFILSNNVCEIKLVKFPQDEWFFKSFLGGNSELYLQPLYTPLNDFINNLILTPCSNHCIIWLFDELFSKMYSQTGMWWWISPTLKSDGFRNSRSLTLTFSHVTTFSISEINSARPVIFPGLGFLSGDTHCNSDAFLSTERGLKPSISPAEN